MFVAGVPQLPKLLVPLRAGDPRRAILTAQTLPPTDSVAPSFVAPSFVAYVTPSYKNPCCCASAGRVAASTHRCDCPRVFVLLPSPHILFARHGRVDTGQLQGLLGRDGRGPSRAGRSQGHPGLLLQDVAHQDVLRPFVRHRPSRRPHPRTSPTHHTLTPHTATSPMHHTHSPYPHPIRPVPLPGPTLSPLFSPGFPTFPFRSLALR